jgi:hypothetical protein
MSSGVVDIDRIDEAEGRTMRQQCDERIGFGVHIPTLLVRTGCYRFVGHAAFTQDAQDGYAYV